MNIKGFDSSFLKGDASTDEVIKSEAFIDKVMVPSNYFEVVAAVSALVATDRKAEDAISVMCEVIRNCKTNSDYLSYLEDVKNKDDKDLSEVITLLKTKPVDSAISFGTLITELVKYGFVDESAYKLLMWVLVTGAYHYLKAFGRFSESTGKHVAAMAVITNMFQELKVITPFLYSYTEDEDYDDIEEVYPEFYHFLESEYDYGEDYTGTLRADDFVSFMNYKRTLNDTDAILVYNELIDLIYDSFEDDEEQYSQEYFLECLTMEVLATVRSLWMDKSKSAAAERLITEFITKFKNREDDDEN